LAAHHSINRYIKKSLPRGQEDTSFKNTLENAGLRYQDVGIGYLLDDITDKIKSQDLKPPSSHQSTQQSVYVTALVLVVEAQILVRLSPKTFNITASTSGTPKS